MPRERTAIDVAGGKPIFFIQREWSDEAGTDQSIRLEVRFCRNCGEKPIENGFVVVPMFLPQNVGQPRMNIRGLRPL